MRKKDQCTYKHKRIKGIVRHAAGVFKWAVGCFLIARQKICTRLVMKNDTNINGSACDDCSMGIAQSTAIQSLASPAPIQSLAQADNKAKLASHTFRWPGKCATAPAMNNGSVYQFGMRRVRRSYRLIAKT